MSEIVTEFTIYCDDVARLESIDRGLVQAYEGDRTASDRYFLDTGIPVWPEGHDAWEDGWRLIEYERDNQCIRGIIESGTTIFDEEEFLRNLSQAGTKYLLANIFDSQVGEKYIIAYKDKRKARPTTVIKELAQIDPTVALSIAIEQRRAKDAASLIEQGANPNGKVAGKPFLVLAVENENITIVKALLEAGADPDAQSPINLDDGYSKVHSQSTALHWAVLAYTDRMARLLLKYGANVNVQDYEGRTPIFYAFWNSDEAGHIERLLKAGADMQVRDKYGKTPLLSMLESYHGSDSEGPSPLEVLDMMLQKGADPHAVCRYGGNALWYGAHSAEQVERLKTLGVTELQAPEGVYAEDIVRNLRTAIVHDDRQYFFSQVDRTFESLSPNNKASLLLETVWDNRLDYAKWLLEHDVSPVAAYQEQPSAKPKTAYQAAKNYKRDEMLALFKDFSEGAIASQETIVSEVRAVFDKFVESLKEFKRTGDNYQEVKIFFDSTILQRFDDEESEKAFLDFLGSDATSSPYEIELQNNYDGSVECLKINESGGNLKVQIKNIDGELKIVKVG